MLWYYNTSLPITSVSWPLGSGSHRSSSRCFVKEHAPPTLPIGPRLFRPFWKWLHSANFQQFSILGVCDSLFSSPTCGLRCCCLCDCGLRCFVSVSAAALPLVERQQQPSTCPHAVTCTNEQTNEQGSEKRNRHQLTGVCVGSDESLLYNRCESLVPTTKATTITRTTTTRTTIQTRIRARTRARD